MARITPTDDACPERLERIEIRPVGAGAAYANAWIGPVRVGGIKLQHRDDGGVGVAWPATAAVDDALREHVEHALIDAWAEAVGDGAVGAALDAGVDALVVDGA